MSVHPTAKQIELLALGTLEPAEADAVRCHLEDCTECRALHEECDQNLRWEVDLRRAAVNSPGAPVPVADESAHGEGKKARATIDIEGYTVIRRIEAGGQGVVFLAEQHFPKRHVAIKVLHERFSDSPIARRRFEREILVAAKLRHPHVVSIFNSGVLPKGQRFYVMEYVRGLPLTAYVRENKLDLPAALELFAKVCNAVHYAHQRGIMHRDLKPSNIFVDADGSPKVLDFGLARPVVGFEDASISETGQVLGAPAYLSPEQTRGNPDEIDIRTDVYSLGVILYELLTGCYPYDVEAGWPDLITSIREKAPTPLSRAWKTGSGIYPARRTSGIRRPRSHHCPIDKELETIVLTCLRKEQDRRYQSAGDLARDLRRYLVGEPISAYPDSVLYILRKKLQRHRKPLLLATVAGLLTVAALVFGLVQKSRLARQAAQLDQSTAREIMASFVADPIRATEMARTTKTQVRDRLVRSCKENLSSQAFTDRIAGVRSAIVLDPASFWSAVDGGAVWANGEWLEVCRMEWPDKTPLFKELMQKAVNGSDRQKYVALCLIGQLAQDDEEALSACVNAVRTERQPGVVAAARWAATRLGTNVPFTATAGVFPDPLTGATFVRIPACDRFRQGSPASEADRHPNETQPADGVPIGSFWLGVTEVTSRQLDRFREWELTGVAPVLRDEDRDAGLAAGRLDLVFARRCCEWLSSHGREMNPPRRYRMPTEIEWECACRAGNAGRFCYGNIADYLPYFGNCNGDEQSHSVAMRMPNWYGLFDMHGGLWELTDTLFPPELVEVPKDKDKELFVTRGGAFYSPAVRCRSAQRNYAMKDTKEPCDDRYYNGFRLVMEIEQP
ncbi:MAG: protein kinase [Phycisphaerae bacterium]|nr:protein kinase [Phycisphaerae bacterium]